MSITKKQKAILEFIKEYQRKSGGISPSMEEIKKHFNLKAVSTVFGHIYRLKKAGFIEKEWNSKRSIKIKKEENFKKIPLIGIVSAGLPIEVLEDKEFLDIPEFLLSSGENFVLKVSGNSMKDDGIHDGDYIIISKNNNPKNGDLVIALVEGEITLKKYFREGKKIKLQPANPSFKPLFINEDKIQVQGIVIGLVRKYK